MKVDPLTWKSFVYGNRKSGKNGCGKGGTV